MNRLAEAVQKLNALWGELPRAAAWVREALEEARNIIPYIRRGEEGFVEDDPVNTFGEEVELIISAIDRDYREQEDEPIRRRDEIGHRIDKLRVEMNAFLEYAGIRSVIAPALERIEGQLGKMATIFPDRLDFRRSVESLQEDRLSAGIIEHLSAALDLFNQGRYADAVLRCGRAGEALTDLYADYLSQFGVRVSERDWYPRLEAIRRSLANAQDSKGGSLGTTRRLEWYVLFLLLNIYWLRNAAAHGRHRDEALPEWMDEYRISMVDTSEHARIALICALQASIQLQVLIGQRR